MSRYCFDNNEQTTSQTLKKGADKLRTFRTALQRISKLKVTQGYCFAQKNTIVKITQVAL